MKKSINDEFGFGFMPDYAATQQSPFMWGSAFDSCPDGCGKKGKKKKGEKKGKKGKKRKKGKKPCGLMECAELSKKERKRLLKQLQAYPYPTQKQFAWWQWMMITSMPQVVNMWTHKMDNKAMKKLAKELSKQQGLMMLPPGNQGSRPVIEVLPPDDN